MKFTIEVDEFWLDDESELQPALTKYIINNVTSQIEKSINEKVDEHISRKVKADIEEGMYRFINLAIDEIIKKETVKTSNGKEVTMTDYIKEYFNNRNSYRNADDVISKAAQNFGNEMKNRYDLLFASQLVAKMHNNGLLKEEVAKLLLEKQVPA